ncbi:DUF72 domain-containing protein [Pseudomonas borbori]
MSDIRIGISGWRYAPWRGDFYPEGLVQRKELHFASRAVNSIEINGSFYALQTPQRYADWYADTPDDFIFSVKAPRYITHIRRLRDVKKPIGNFFASGVLQLKEKLGPILWQFPPSFKFDEALFGEFLALLPKDTKQAKACAKAADEQMQQADALPRSANRPLRHAVEIRNESFIDPAFVALLDKHQVALVVADTAGKWPQQEDLTADFVYIRLHGDEVLYESGYSTRAINYWHARIDAWRDGRQPEDAKLIDPARDYRHQQRDVYCYFDNDTKVRAPFDARSLLEKFDLADALEATPGILQGAVL